MPTTIPARRREAKPTSDDEFLALVCSDEELLRAEFDAIIAAGWSSPPPDEPNRDGAAKRRPGSAGRRAPSGPSRPPKQRRHPTGTDGWARQRSPPPIRAQTEDRTAGDRHTYISHEVAARLACAFGTPASDAYCAAPTPHGALLCRPGSRSHTAVPAAPRAAGTTPDPP
jgi:hypothetical protein